MRIIEDKNKNKDQSKDSIINKFRVVFISMIISVTMVFISISSKIIFKISHILI